ncbi:hypothetical protein [Eikenella corrodens]|uniref:hypothetical protein n=1 Tax=Eikenella corrodens TaxID=539 RepID=UPI00066827FA|nr:hypothetical protein [Eikenella corrodens]
MNLRYLYNHHKNTVTIQAELMGYLPAENAPHSWSTRKPRPGEIDVVSEKTFKQSDTAAIHAYVESLYAADADIRDKANHRLPVARTIQYHYRGE